MVTNATGPILWKACHPDQRHCQVVGRGREVLTRGVTAGTFFMVSSDGATGRSPRWQGPLRAVRRPSVFGELRANTFVSPLPSLWRGGWEGEFSEMQLAACRTANGKGCITLTHPHFVRSCRAGASFSLDERLAGTFLRVANRRVGPNPAAPQFAVTSPSVGTLWPSNRSTSVRMLGAIEAATGEFPGECGPPAPGEATVDKLGRAFVDCQGGCLAVLVARGNGRVYRERRKVAPRNALWVRPPAEMRLGRKGLEHLGGSGRFRVLVKLEGRIVAARTVRFGVI